MKSSIRSHYFSGWARLFEWLLSLVLVIGTITCIVFFFGSAHLMFADRIPDFMDRDIRVEMGESAFEVTDSSQQDLPIDLEYVEVELTVPAEEPRLLMTYSSTELVGYFLGLAATFHLLKFVRSLRRNHPFIPENAHRLRCVAWLMLVGGIWQGVAKLLVALSTNNVFPQLNLNISLRGDGVPLVTVLTFFVIAEVFALGVKMKEEADLTV